MRAIPRASHIDPIRQSVAVPRDRDVERLDKRAPSIDVGASLPKTSQDRPPRRSERVVEFLAGVVIRDSQDNIGPTDR